MINITECEKALGYKFKDKQLLVEAFTHSSYANEHKELKSNELLEFFGDSIIGFIVSEYLYSKKKNSSEGKLTVLRQHYVSREPLAKAVLNNQLEKFLIASDGVINSSLNSPSICENLFEAIVASIYLDGGMECAKKFVFKKLISANKSQPQAEAKGELQEYIQMRHLGKLSYKELKRTGPAHKPTFLVAVMLDDNEIARGKGNTKQEAERSGAKEALSKLKKKKGNNL